MTLDIIYGHGTNMDFFFGLSPVELRRQNGHEEQFAFSFTLVPMIVYRRYIIQGERERQESEPQMVIPLGIPSYVYLYIRIQCYSTIVNFLPFSLLHITIYVSLAQVKNVNKFSLLCFRNLKEERRGLIQLTGESKRRKKIKAVFKKKKKWSKLRVVNNGSPRWDIQKIQARGHSEKKKRKKALINSKRIFENVFLIDR